MSIQFLLNAFQHNSAEDAIVWRGKTFTYGWLFDRVQYWLEVMESEKIQSGTVVALEADFSPDSIALFLALSERGCILVPITTQVKDKKLEFFKIASVQRIVKILADDRVEIESVPSPAAHEFYNILRASGSPGLVLFSSGSTGKSKAIVHDLTRILQKYRTRKPSLRTITFLLYDHIGGINTMLHTLANGGCIITIGGRTPDQVLSAVENYQAELLPTSPTFLNLILIGEAYKRYTLNSLKIISYGTEPMPESTLHRFHELYPHIRLLQTYGLSELGILSSKSKDSNSLWLRLQGDDFETRIIDGILHIRSNFSMLGYLNAPAPITEDGWLNTGDAVEVDGEYIRFLGRKSEIINVGGEKVYPAEVENTIQSLTNVATAVVYGEKNSLVGEIVCAKVTLKAPENAQEFRQRLQAYCRIKLEDYKVPLRIQIVEEHQYNERFKKTRVLSG